MVLGPTLSGIFPTESLILPNRRIFYPVKIPKSHPQLHQYISTADPDRIYVASQRQLYTIHVSSCTLEYICRLPFWPKCLAAGYGWVCAGGDRGLCSFINVSQPTEVGEAGQTRADVDSPLPLDVDPALRHPLPWQALQPAIRRRPQNRTHVREFNGQIANSVTIHRFPGDGDTYVDEDVAIFSNNDPTVTIYSLTRMDVLEEIRVHHTSTNHAIMSPDGKVMAAIGGEHKIYFYTVTPSCKSRIVHPTDDSERMLMGREWTFVREYDILPRSSNKAISCSFTIAFSSSSDLCAVASQSSIIVVFDVAKILRQEPGDPVLSSFQSSRPSSENGPGAIRCMTFSPAPWDLLVWAEHSGRIGVADVRRGFQRQQIIELDPKQVGVETVHLQSGRESNQNEGSGNLRGGRFDQLNQLLDAIQEAGRRPGGVSDEQRGELMDLLADRRDELQEYFTYNDELSSVSGAPVHHARDSNSPSPARDRNQHLDRRSHPRRRPSIFHHHDSHSPSTFSPLPVTVRYARSPPQISPAQTQDEENRMSLLTPVVRLQALAEPVASLGSLGFNGSRLIDTRRRSGRARSIPRREEDAARRREEITDPNLAPIRRLFGRLSPPLIPPPDPETDPEAEVESGLELDSEFRSLIDPEGTPWRYGVGLSDRERQYLMNVTTIRGVEEQERELWTVGLGWGKDGQTLYVGTVVGVLELHVDTHDRKGFPSISCC